MQYHYARYKIPNSDNRTEIERSMTPGKSKTNKIREETMLDYLNFPDPQLYLVGFVCFESMSTDITTDFDNRRTSVVVPIRRKQTSLALHI